MQGKYNLQINMVYQLAKKIASEIAKKKFIENSDEEVIAYGLFSIFFKAIFAIICFITGLFLRCFIESVCFYFSFLYIKKYAGGYHAKTEARCFLLSSLSIIISMILIYFSKTDITTQVLVFMVLVLSSALTTIYAPIPSKERPLDKSENSRYHKVVIKRNIFLILVIIASIAINKKTVAISIAIAVILESILLIAGKIKMENTV